MIIQLSTLDDQKADHTVFLLQPDENILGLVDEAWLARDGSMVVDHTDDWFKSWWVIPMKRKVGTKGEVKICLIVQGLNEVVTAYPVSDAAKCKK